MSTLSITIKSLDGVFMSQKSFTFKAVAAALGAVTICAAGALSYVYVNSIVEYEVEQDETEYVSTEKNDITVRTPEDIPQSDSYNLLYDNNALCVYTSDGNLVYKDTTISLKDLPKSDADALSGDGIRFQSRSDLIELLTYLKS